MTYFAMARRWRPQTFSEVTAQSHITETLATAIESSRVASAYLFTGPRGSGKTTVARIVAKAVNCDNRKGGEPCSKCESCVGIAEGRSLDVLEIDGASNNSVDDVRELRENVRYAASAPGKRKVYIVDEVHMLSGGAFNALLKTLEEPPAHVLFVFATTEPRKVPATILSRCQRFDFRRLLTSEILARLQHICKKEKIDVEDAALFMLAKRADGSLRDALSLFDQVISSSSGRIAEAQVSAILGVVQEDAYFDLTDAILARDAVRALHVLHVSLEAGADPAGFALGLVEHFRNLLLLSVNPSLRQSVQLGELHLQRALELAGRFKTEDLLYLLNRAAAIYEDTRRASQPSVVLEAAMVEVSRFESRVVLSELLSRLDGPGGPAPEDSTGGGARGAGARTAAPQSARGPGSRKPSPRAELVASSNEAAGSDAVGEDTAGEAPAVRLQPDLRIVAGGVPPAGGLATGSAERSARPAASRRPSNADPQTRPAAARSAATTHVADGPLALEQVVERWDDFTHELRLSKTMLAHFVCEGRPVLLEGQTLELAFAADHAFQLGFLQEATKKRELEGYLGAFFGQPLKVSLHSDAEPSRSSTPTAALDTMDGGDAGAGRITSGDVARSRRGAIEDVVQKTPGLEAIIDAFEGEVLDDHDA